MNFVAITVKLNNNDKLEILVDQYNYRQFWLFNKWRK